VLPDAGTLTGAGDVWSAALAYGGRAGEAQEIEREDPMFDVVHDKSTPK
jgi:hypothetical protein